MEKLPVELLCNVLTESYWPQAPSTLLLVSKQFLTALDPKLAAKINDNNQTDSVVEEPMMTRRIWQRFYEERFLNGVSIDWDRASSESIQELYRKRTIFAERLLKSPSPGCPCQKYLRYLEGFENSHPDIQLRLLLASLLPDSLKAAYVNFDKGDISAEDLQSMRSKFYFNGGGDGDGDEGGGLRWDLSEHSFEVLAFYLKKFGYGEPPAEGELEAELPKLIGKYFSPIKYQRLLEKCVDKNDHLRLVMAQWQQLECRICASPTIIYNMGII